MYQFINNVCSDECTCTSLYIHVESHNIEEYKNIDITYLPLGFQAGLLLFSCDSSL